MYIKCQSMKSMSFCITALGKMAIVDEGRSITQLCLPGELPPSDAALQNTDLLDEAIEQLKSYLCGERRVFELPLAPQGTDFMQRVWQCLLAIPYGETSCYREIAESLNKPLAFRAVGAACRRNPLPLFIPCHRVIGRDGSLTGYRGGLQIKEQLLNLEGADIGKRECHKDRNPRR